MAATAAMAAMAVTAEGITAKCRKAIATDWIEGRRMPATAGLSIRTTPAIIEVATARTAKGSAEGTIKVTASTPVMGDGNRPHIG
jgi:hypothetical protein